MKLGDELPTPLSDGSARSVTDTTLGEYGDQLPLGFYQDSVLHRGFAFRVYKSSIEHELDALRQKNKGMTEVEWASYVLATMLTRLGPFDLTGMALDERRMLVLRCWMPDVLYMLIRLRRAALGTNVGFDLTCGRCDHKWRSEIDLDSIETKVSGDPASLTRRHVLRDGVEIGGKVYRELIIDPPRWSVLTGVRTRSSSAAEFATLAGAVRYAVPPTTDAIPMMITPDNLGEFSKFDFEMLRKAVDEGTLGPDMMLTADCPHCGSTTKYGVDWSWGFFFKSVSL